MLLCYLWEICRRLVLSIAGSGQCVILVSFIKLWVGTLQGLQACLVWVPTRQEDVLISLGPKVTLNLLKLHLKEKKLRWVNLFCWFSFAACSIESLSEGQAEPHLLKLVSKPLKIFEKALLPVLWDRRCTALCQPDPCYKSFYKHTLSRSNVQACFPDALLRSETCQYKSWFKW